MQFTDHSTEHFQVLRQLLERFEQELANFASRCQPELIVISAGFDAHQNDPIGSLGLTSEDFGRWTVFVKDLEHSVHIERLFEA